jgi:serine/threonine protein kinase
MSSDPRANREDAHKTVPKSGTSRPAASTTPDEKQLRSLRARLSALFRGRVVEIEQIDRLLKDLPEDLRQILAWKLEGYTNAEIASEIQRTVRCVELKLQIIRKRLRQEPDPNTRSHDRLSGTPEPVTPPVEVDSSSTGEWQSLPSPSSEVGEAVFDKYRLLEKIGEGGIGRVWRAWNIGRERECALKLIKAKVAPNDPWWERFTGDARRLAAFKHPAAVAVYDLGKVGDFAYIEMEYVRGLTLRQWLKPGEPLPLEMVEWLLHELCEVLGQAHEIGIVHRNIKPTKILIVINPESGLEQVKVRDFGVVSIVAEEGVAGTPAYMAPEQIRGDIDARDRIRTDRLSDLYSIGVILYELLTGSHPFSGSANDKILFAQVHAPPPPFNEKAPGIHVHPAIEAVVLRCLNKNPDDRPQSASELFEQFRKAIDIAKAHDERSMRAEEGAPAIAPSSPRSASRGMGLFRDFLAKLGRSFKEGMTGSASARAQGLESRDSVRARMSWPRERVEPLPIREVPATISRRADISFPAQVSVGQSYHLQVIPTSNGFFLAEK